MRLVSSIMGAALALSLAACGSNSGKQSDNGQAQKPEVTGEAQSASDIPSAAIVRVPVDADGNPTGEPEMKVVQSGDVADSQDSVVAAFDAGAAPQKLVATELDAESSTQSWTSYSYAQTSYQPSYQPTYQPQQSYQPTYQPQQSYQPTYQPQQSYQPSYNYSSYNQSYFVNSYKPQMYYQQQTYNYGYSNNYIQRGYSYYCYRPFRANYGYGQGGGIGGGFGGGYKY